MTAKGRRERSVDKGRWACFSQVELVCLDLEAVLIIFDVLFFFWSEAILLLYFANSLLLFFL